MAARYLDPVFSVLTSFSQISVAVPAFLQLSLQQPYTARTASCWCSSDVPYLWMEDVTEFTSTGLTLRAFTSAESCSKESFSDAPGSCNKSNHQPQWSYTVRCRYNAVNYLRNIHQRHPIHAIARPLGRGMGCLLLVQPLIDILPQFLQ